MKHLGNEADRIIRVKRLKKKDIAEKMGITDVYLSRLLKYESFDASLLEKLSKVIHIPITYWFEESEIKNQSIVNGNGSAASIYGNASAGELIDKDKEISHLKDLLQEKENIIKEKERTIQILMSK